IVAAQPWVELFGRFGEPRSEHDFAKALAFDVEGFSIHVLVAARFEQLDGRLFGQPRLVPPQGHAASSSGVTRSSPVRRTDMRAVLVDFRASSTLLSASQRCSTAANNFAISCCSQSRAKATRSS